MPKIHTLFENITRELPNKTAVLFGSKVISYSELNAKANQFARYLLKSGVTSKEFVPIFLDKSIESIIAVLALLKLGAVYTPISLEWPEKTRKLALEDVHCSHIVTHSTLSFVGSSDKLIFFDQFERESESYSKFNLECFFEENDDFFLANITFTSGTTGRPKGVMVTHENLISIYHSWEKIYQLTSEDVHLQMANFAFDVFTGDMIRALCSGGTLVLCPKEILLNPKDLYDLINTSKVTCAEFVPTTLKQLAHFVEHEKLKLDVRLLICGSDSLTMTDIRKIEKACTTKTTVINSYGVTEATIDSTYFVLNSEYKPSLNQLVPIGVPFPHVSIYIMDEQGRPVKEGEPGELYIGGHGVALGYLNQPETTKEKFVTITHSTEIKERVYKTGDIAKFLPGGMISFLGRNHTQVKINGHRIELGAIETVLSDHPKIKSAVVIHSTNSTGKVQLECILALSNRDLFYEDLIKHLKQSLPFYSIPYKFYLVDDIPLTTNFKIDRRALLNKPKQEISPTYVAPRTPIELELRNIWCDILNVDPVISIRQYFCELGGDSLSYAKMLHRVNGKWNLDIPISTKVHNIEELSILIEKQISQKKILLKRTDPRKHKIAIIGGGPSGLSALMQLIKSLNEKNLASDTEILVFEKNSAIGSGLPYSQEEDCFILNLPQEIMSPLQEEKEGFSNWLKKSGLFSPKSKFPPRYFFGNYLKELATQICNDQESTGVVLKYYVRCEVIDIQNAKHDAYNIVTNQGTYSSEYIILCTGHMPCSTYRHLIGVQGYYHNPWELSEYKKIKPNDSVGIIGTRLSAIDCALKLFSSGHKGEVYMLSRTGLLPTVLAKDVPHFQLRYLTLQNFAYITQSGLLPLPLEKLTELFWKEISAAEKKNVDYTSIPKSTEDISPLDWLNQEICSAELGKKTWQQVLFAIYPIIPTIWNHLTFSDKKFFLDHYYGIFLTYLAAFPLENAYKIRERIISGQLKIYGGLQKIESCDWRHSLTLANRVITTHHLFNGTGPGHDPLLMPLYQKMYDSKLIYPDELGGIHVNSQTLQVDGSKNMYAIGELTKGACLATTDYGQVTNQCRRVITGITRSIISKKIEYPTSESRVKNNGYQWQNYFRATFFKKLLTQHTNKKLVLSMVFGAGTIGTTAFVQSHNKSPII